MNTSLTETSSESQLLSYCRNCGSIHLKKHGTYIRKTRIGDLEVLYPVPIPRAYCCDCKCTFSLLPEWLPPRRWYIWKVQEHALLAFLVCTSIRMISKQYKVARSTLRRWFGRLKDRFADHADQLKQLLPDILGRTNDFFDFWSTCLSQYSLAQTMGYLRNAGIEIP